MLGVDAGVGGHGGQAARASTQTTQRRARYLALNRWRGRSGVVVVCVYGGVCARAYGVGVGGLSLSLCVCVGGDCDLP